MGDLSLSMIDLKERDVDVSSVNICRTLRKFANSGNEIVFERNIHGNNPYNLHLISYIESELNEYNRINGTNDSLEDFFRRYLSNLQPYSLVQAKLHYGNEMLAVVDYSYKYPIYIKIDKELHDNPSNTSKKQQIIVSFHEDYLPNKETIVESRRNRIELFDSEIHKYIPVITNDYEEDYSDRNAYMIRFPYSVGMNTIDIEIHNAEITDGNYFIIPSYKLHSEIIQYCHELFDEIVEFSYVRDGDNIPDKKIISDIEYVFSKAVTSVSDLSFTSLGTTLQSVLSYFVDIKTGCASNRFVGIPEKKLLFIEDAATVILNTYLNNCKGLNSNKINEAISFLDTRYAPHIKNNKHVATILTNIKAQLLRLSSSSSTTRAIDNKKEWKNFTDTYASANMDDILRVENAKRLELIKEIKTEITSDSKNNTGNTSEIKNEIPVNNTIEENDSEDGSENLITTGDGYDEI